MKHPDDSDRATDLEQAARDEAVNRIRAAAPNRLKPTGYCFYCSEPVRAPKIFCDAACAGDYDHEQKLKRASGRS